VLLSRRAEIDENTHLAFESNFYLVVVPMQSVAFPKQHCIFLYGKVRVVYSVRSGYIEGARETNHSHTDSRMCRFAATVLREQPLKNMTIYTATRQQALLGHAVLNSRNLEDRTAHSERGVGPMSSSKNMPIIPFA
jgi:hypothetical protein